MNEMIALSTPSLVLIIFIAWIASSAFTILFFASAAKLRDKADQDQDEKAPD